MSEHIFNLFSNILRRRFHMKTNGYEILNPISTSINVPNSDGDFNFNCEGCGDTDAYCPDYGCDIDAGCSCGVNELDCSYRMGNR